MATITKTNLFLASLNDRDLDDQEFHVLAGHARDLARRIDAMMLRVANTPVPEGQEALDLFGSIASDLRDLARGEA